MNWKNITVSRSESDHGYLVSAFQAYGQWVYLAEGPKREVEGNKFNVLAYIDPVLGRLPMKVYYAKGETIPTPRELFGYYSERKCGSVSGAMRAAIAACEEHWVKCGGCDGDSRAIA